MFLRAHAFLLVAGIPSLVGRLFLNRIGLMQEMLQNKS